MTGIVPSKISPRFDCSRGVGASRLGVTQRLIPSLEVHPLVNSVEARICRRRVNTEHLAPVESCAVLRN